MIHDGYLIHSLGYWYHNCSKREALTHIEVGLVHVCPLKDAVCEITVGEVAAAQIGTFEVDVSEVKVRQVHTIQIYTLSTGVRVCVCVCVCVCWRV